MTIEIHGRNVCKTSPVYSIPGGGAKSPLVGSESMRPALLFLSVAMLASCTKEESKITHEEPKKATPVTSADLGSFNDFLPPSGGAKGLAVKLDGGLEGGAGLPTGGGDGEPAAAGAEDKLKVTDQGAEPRAQRKYAFVANRTDKRLLT